jgi:hypothetical protein
MVLEAALGRLDDDSELADQIAEELAERGHEADTRRMNR